MKSVCFSVVCLGVVSVVVVCRSVSTIVGLGSR